MARAKKNVTQVPNEAGAQVCMQEYAHATSELKKIEAQLELEIQRIREKYQSRITPLKSVQADTFEKLQAFAEHNRDDLFSKKKSRDFTHGIIGFRMGQMKVAYDRGMSSKALPLVITLGLPFTRGKIELDKEKVIASRDDAETMNKLRQCGISVTQEESFYVEVKEEEVVTA